MQVVEILLEGRAAGLKHPTIRGGWNMINSCKGGWERCLEKLLLIIGYDWLISEVMGGVHVLHTVLLIFLRVILESLGDGLSMFTIKNAEFQMITSHFAMGTIR